MSHRTKRRAQKSTDDQLMDIEDQEGLTFIDVKKDGNCFFHTMELYYKLQGKEYHTHTSLRAAFVSYILHHNDRFCDISKEEIGVLQHNGTWNPKISNILLSMAALAYGVTIHVYNLKQNTKTILYPDEMTETILSIAQFNGSHFGLLVPLVPLVPFPNR